MFENNIIDLAIEFLKKEFPNKSNSWIKRAFIRFILNSIKQIRNNLWIVKGIPELGDKFEHYEVVYIPEQNRYYCSCFEHLWGFKRRKEICTHIAAVILWKKYNHLNEIVYAYFLRLKCCNSIIQILNSLMFLIIHYHSQKILCFSCLNLLSTYLLSFTT